MRKTFAEVEAWALAKGVHVERYERGDARYQVFTDGSTIADCKDLDEVISTVPEFERTPPEDCQEQVTLTLPRTMP